MTITITAFRASPDEGQGLARDMRVRWALEEVGQPYNVQLVTFEELKQPTYRRLQPFGQIPAYREDGLVLFESGAIVLHLAQRYPGLLPDDQAARERTIAWLFAALNTVEPPVVERESAPVVEQDEPWYAARLPLLDERVRARLADLAAALGDSEWLEGGFSVADLMMVMVLRRLDGTNLVAEFPTLADYVARGTGRPAYQRAFAAQRAVFEAN